MVVSNKIWESIVLLPPTDDYLPTNGAQRLEKCPKASEASGKQALPVTAKVPKPLVEETRCLSVACVMLNDSRPSVGGGVQEDEDDDEEN